MTDYIQGTTLLTIEAAIDLAKTCRSKRQIIKVLEQWLEEKKLYERLTV